MIAYAATTQDITVTVRPVYLDSQSNYFERRFVFGYFVRVENNSLLEVQLLRRYWHIEESTGRIEEVEGEGVIGKQPIISPGGIHQYHSYSVLQSFEGHMEGYYTMEYPDGERFRVTIPRFFLRAHAN